MVHGDSWQAVFPWFWAGRRFEASADHSSEEVLAEAELLAAERADDQKATPQANPFLQRKSLRSALSRVWPSQSLSFEHVAEQ